MTARWALAKAALVPHDTVVRSLLHVHVGMLIYLAAVACAPRRFRSGWAVLLVLGLVLANEALDLGAAWPDIRPWLWRDSLGDVANTMAWPVAIWLLALVRGPGDAAAPRDQSSDPAVPPAPPSSGSA